MLRSRVSGYLRCAMSTGAALVALLPAAIAPAAEGIDAKGEVTRVQFRRPARDAESDDWLYRGIETLQPGNSSSAIRRKAMSELPLDRLRPEARARAELILKDVGLFRRLPALQFEVDPEVYRYFLEHPDVAVGTWRAMEISKFELKPTRADVYHADAGDGSVGEVEVFYRTPGDTLIACDGAFKSPLLARPIVARALIRVQTEFHREMDGRVIAVQNGDLFVQFPSTTVETVAKIISPVSHSIADRNFKQITLFMYMMSQAAGKQPGWVESIGRRLDRVSDEERVEFLEMAARAYVTARRRELSANEPDKTFSVDEILSPLRQSNNVDPMGTTVIRAASGEIPMNLPGPTRR